VSGGALTDFGGAGGMTYNGRGDRLAVPTTVTGNAGLTGATAYGYDARGRPLSETSAGTAWAAKTNVYDLADNPTTLRSTAGLAYNANNQRVGDTFDGNGNPTTYSGTTFAYNSDNQLTAVGTALTANYGADGLRAWKANSGGTKTYFLYDGRQPVCEYNAAGTVTALNIFGPNGLVSRTTTTTTAFYTFDANGNTSQRTDTSGAVTSTEAYDAYGARTSAFVDPFGYGAQFGYYTDSETGLVLCGHRYYDPAKARWVTRDPIGYAGGINLYGYCGGGPVGAGDPSGYCFTKFKNWYWNGMGGASAWTDKHLLGNNFHDGGDDAGRGNNLGAAYHVIAGTAIAASYGVGVAGAYRAGTRVVADEGVTLWRGVGSKSPIEGQFEAALKGEAHPLDGHSDPLAHNGGDTHSVFTSWTTDQNIASEAARGVRGDPPGVVLENVFKQSELTQALMYLRRAKSL
jgi:RHS repeat-associated protein